MKFEDFKLERYSHAPYDFPSNKGFIFPYVPGGSDISAHLPFLEYLASKCKTVTEFGTRDCYSTAAFIAGKPTTVISYDIITTPSIEVLQKIEKPCEWIFRQQSTCDKDVIIDKTDLLFIDTIHSYEQVKAELELHASKVYKYLLFHDTTSFPQIVPAIKEFVDKYSNWKNVYEVNFNNGLLLLENQWQS